MGVLFCIRGKILEQEIYMKAYSKTRKDFGVSKPRREAEAMDFILNYCDIHGRLGDMVYRHKRNGEFYSYEYEKHQKYDPTTLSKRTSIVMKKINTFTNKQQEGFDAIISRMYYYTPYFVYAGDYGFTCNRFLKISIRQDYFIQIDDGAKVSLHLAGRTRLKLRFADQGEHILRCWEGEELHCERKIVVIPNEQVLETVYADWFDLHLAEILEMPDPLKAKVEKYSRCVMPPDWLFSLTGTCKDFVMYSTRNSNLPMGRHKYNYMWSRKLADMSGNVQTHYFLRVQPRVNSCWKAMNAGCRVVWEKYYNLWFEANYRKKWHATGPQNLWSQVIFRAGKALGFDMESLSIEHFLPRVETIGDLIAVAGLGRYGLGEEELKTKIYYHE